MPAVVSWCRRGRRWRRWPLAVVACLAATSGASASTLGGLSAQTLSAWSSEASVAAPAVVTCDSFALPASTGSALAGRPVQLPATCGTSTWGVHLGTWTISSGQLQAVSSNATASLPAGSADVSVQATILNANGSSRVAGVALNHSGTTRVYLAAVLSGPNKVQLRLVNGASITTIASASATFGSSALLHATRQGTTVTIAVNGVTALTYTLTPAQSATLTGGTRVGLYWRSGGSIRFTDFAGTAP